MSKQKYQKLLAVPLVCVLVLSTGLSNTSAVFAKPSRVVLNLTQYVDPFIGTDDEYLVFCGVIGLGRLLAEGVDVEQRLRGHATDVRWRVREGDADAGCPDSG